MTELVGHQLGSYRLLHLQGRGGFADVYQGEHIHLKSLAAIKVLHSRIDFEQQDHFLHEARILARLSHPHIIRILDFGLEKAMPFLVMEFASHGTIRQRHPHGSPLPLKTAVLYVQQIADGLQYAHDQKLIHRDLKPENILINQRGELLLSDFGIALMAQTTYTASDEPLHRFAGTAAYMAPEQFQGHPRYASDQYALAVMVYEWLCGTRPFSGTFIEICSQHLSIAPPALRKRAPNIPVEVEEVLLTALNKDLEQRFASVKAFAKALEQASQSTTYTALPIQNKSSHFAGIAPTPSSPVIVPSLEMMPASRLDQSDHAMSTPISLPKTPTIHSEVLSSGYEKSRDQIQRESTVSLVTAEQDEKIEGEAPIPSKWFFQRKVLLFAGLILLLLLGSNTALFFFLHSPSTSSSQKIGQVTNSPPLLHTTPTFSKATATVTVKPNYPQQVIRTTPSAQATIPPVLPPKNPPTPTSLPPTPTKAASNGGLLYSSSLSTQDSANWDVFSYAGGGGCAFAGNAYHATMPQMNSVSQCFAESSSVTNFTYQVQMKILQGDGGGLIFRSNTSGNFYRLRIGSDGTYDLVSQNSGIANSSSPAIIQGVNQTNLIKVVASGSHIAIYANGQLITRVNDTASSIGRFGVFAVGFSHVTEVVFSNAQVNAL